MLEMCGMPLLKKNHVLIVIQDLQWWHALAVPSALLSLCFNTIPLCNCTALITSSVFIFSLSFFVWIMFYFYCYQTRTIFTIIIFIISLKSLLNVKRLTTPNNKEIVSFTTYQHWNLNKDVFGDDVPLKM